MGDFLQDKKVRELFAIMKSIRQQWTDQQASQLEANAEGPLRINSSASLEDDCFEGAGDHGVAKRYKQKSPPSSVSDKSPQVPGATNQALGSIDKALENVKMSEQQQEELNKVLKQIAELEAKSSPPTTEF